MKKTKFFAIFSLLAMASLLLGACGSSASGQELNGTSWTLTSINGVPLADGSNPITIEFGSETELGGTGGCNGYGGNYSVGSDGSIDISGVVSTMMACEPQIIMENEAAYFQALEAVTHYSSAGSTLTLDNGTVILIFTRA